jgi:hypothetical protein
VAGDVSAVVDRPTSRQTHEAHEDERNRVNALARHERALRARTRRQTITPLVQPHEPHAFQFPDLRPVSPRRSWGMPSAPGALDPTGFSNGVC